ncbi:MAG: ribosome biogenesis GTP-binding protein YihA/YsxC [Nitrosomonas sp.]|jgi:GTP-binding protein|nr:ribosome biogenesis GTP-binding protein YihA/YsxC [Nitrosomonas sp.]
MILFDGATFYTSANSLKDLPAHDGKEIAFAGRSNAGKSSVINTLTRRNRLAFTSKTPGRTQQINYFRLCSGHFLVDLPGYGYAKTPITIRKHWEVFLTQYLSTRKELFGLVLIIDIRHPLKDLDLQMLEWFSVTQKPVHILLTKSDKLSRQQATLTLMQVKSFLKINYPLVSVQLFSSSKLIGINEVNHIIQNWIE